MKYSSVLIPLFIVLVFQISLSQENYTLSPKSELAVQGTSTVHEWTMTLNKMHGSLTLEGSQVKDVLFEANVSDLQSDRGATMDNKAKDALKYKEHPKIIFVFQHPQTDPGGKDPYVLHGTMTIAGTAKKVPIPSKMTVGKDFVRLEGNYKIKLQDFNIEPPTAMFGSIVVGDIVTVQFNLLFQINRS